MQKKLQISFSVILVIYTVNVLKLKVFDKRTICKKIANQF